MIRRFLKRKPRDPSDSGALNDLSFILIIFFIVIAGFNVNKGFLLNLPSRDRPRIVQSQELMRVSIDSAGILSAAGEVISLEELSSRIETKIAESPSMTFLLTIDPETPYQQVIDVIGEIRSLRVENFSFRMAGGAP